MKQIQPAGTDNMRDIATTLNELMDGNNNATFKITLGTGTSTKFETDQENIEININSVILFCPLSAGAATELYSGDMFTLEADIKNGEFTVTHSASSNGLEFRVDVTGGSGE